MNPDPSEVAPRGGPEFAGTNRVYLHIGLQKTGTSYLQSIFWGSQGALREQGLDLVPDSKRATFHLMLCVRERYDADLDPPAVAGALDRLPEQLARAGGDRALVTEESLAPASREQAAQLVDACAGREVHLLVTVRDLARQIPSAWQQRLRSGGTRGFEEYVERVVARRGSASGLFWGNQDLPAVLDRWEGLVPPGRIHVVTVPPPGGAPEELLRRYCRVLDVDPATLAVDTARGNTGLGRAQAELLRRVNAGLRPDQRRRQLYGDIGKRFFSIAVLGGQEGERILLPAQHRRWCEEQAAEVAARLEGGGYDLVGDLADLRPSDAAFAPEDRAAGVPETEVSAAATAALAEILGSRIDRAAARRGRPRRPRAGRTARRGLARRLTRRRR